MPEPARPADELRLLVTARDRPEARLTDPVLPSELVEPEIASLVRAAAAARGPGPLWLFGGEPTLRADLPELVGAVASAFRGPIGLRTDGLAIRSAAAAEPLVRAGLGRVRIRLHSPRFDAHDWMTGLRGSGVRALRAAQVCAELGLGLELEALVTRVNAPYLAELVRLGRELRVSAYRFGRLVLGPEVADDAIALGARLGLTEPYLEEAAAAAFEQGAKLSFAGFPTCALGNALGKAGTSLTRALWLSSEEWSGQYPRELAAEPNVRCKACTADCAGAPSDYVARFGAWEFLSERADASSLTSPTPTRRERPQPGDKVLPPAPRGTRSPGTRLRVARGLASSAELDGDPLLPRGEPRVEPSIRTRWQGTTRLASELADAPNSAPEPTRIVRQRLVQVAQYGARRLRVTGDAILTHPAALDLLAELPRLGIAQLELCTEGSVLAELTAAGLQALSCFEHVYVPLFAATAAGHNARVLHLDAFERTLRGAEVLSRDYGTQVSAFAVVANAEDAVAFADAWAQGALPGEPLFRLSEHGSSLDALFDALASLSHAPSRQALERLLPSCLRDAAAATGATALDALEPEFTHTLAPRAASACDRLGQFRSCACGSVGCPGVALGWISNRIEPS